MKKIYTLLFLLTPLSGMAQQVPVFEADGNGLDKNISNSQVNKIKNPNSIINLAYNVSNRYTWVGLQNKWSNSAEKTTYSIAGNGYSYTKTKVDSATNVPIDREIFEQVDNYYGQYNEKWKDGKWEKTTKSTSEKSQDGATISKEYDWRNGVWEQTSETKMISQSDSYGNTTLYSYEYWVGGKLELQQKSKFEYAYPVNGGKNYTGYTRLIWSNNSYVNERKVANIRRDNDDRIVYYENLTWSNGAWRPISRVTTEFKALAPGSSTPIADSRETTERYINGEWVEVSRTTASYPTKDKPEQSSVTEIRRNNSWVISYGFKFVHALDEKGNFYRTVYKIYDNSIGQYINYYRTNWSNVKGSTEGDVQPGVVEVYPNPASLKATLQLTNLSSQKPFLGEIINGAGQVVKRLQVVPQLGFAQHELDISQLKAGVYHLRLHTVEGVITQRLVCK